MSGEPAMLAWAVAGRPVAGEPVSGDLHLVHQSAGWALLALIDGLGHGPAAAAAANAAATALAAAPDEPLVTLTERCHAALLQTRGAVMSLARFDADQRTLTWLGVGNVAGLLMRQDMGGPRQREHLMQRGGIVGQRLPPLRTHTLPIANGDTLVFATDGIRRGFEAGLALAGPPDLVAPGILNDYGLDTDDALVLVATFGRSA